MNTFSDLSAVHCLEIVQQRASFSWFSRSIKSLGISLHFKTLDVILCNHNRKCTRMKYIGHYVCSGIELANLVLRIHILRFLDNVRQLSLSKTNSLPFLWTVNSIFLMQWCSGKFSIVGTLAWHYGHIPYRYWVGGGPN